MTSVHHGTPFATGGHAHRPSVSTNFRHMLENTKMGDIAPMFQSIVTATDRETVSSVFRKVRDFPKFSCRSLRQFLILITKYLDDQPRHLVCSRYHLSRPSQLCWYDLSSLPRKFERLLKRILCPHTGFVDVFDIFAFVRVESQFGITSESS
jgi:hypothetical protein